MPDQTMRERVTDQTPSTEQVERARFNVSAVHHIIGTECLCGARRLHKNRDRTEHILDAFIKELDLAAHDREVAAKALREMSRKLVEMRLDPNLDRHASDYWSGVFQGLLAAEQYVSDEAENARADRIEAGE